MNLGFSIVVYIYYKHQFWCSIYDILAITLYKLQNLLYHLYATCTWKVFTKYLQISRRRIYHSKGLTLMHLVLKKLWIATPVIKRKLSNGHLSYKNFLFYLDIISQIKVLHSFGFLLVDLFARNFPKKVLQHTCYYYIYILKLKTNIINIIIQ